MAAATSQPDQRWWLRHRGADTRLREVKGRRQPTSEGVGLREKRRGAVGIGSLFWTEQSGKRRGEGSVGEKEEEGSGLRVSTWRGEGGPGGRQDARPAEASGGWRGGSARGEETRGGRVWACPGKEERGNGPA
jgi:hypothetical protein